MRKLALVCGLVLMCSFVLGQPQRTAPSGRVRTYYIASDEVDWDYAPTGEDLIHGEKYHFQDDPASKGTLNPNATVYRKAVFREYTDASFKMLKARSDTWAHLGILGPLIRAEVGDTIKVVFKNNASHRFSLHPHGVFYAKASEGAPITRTRRPATTKPTTPSRLAPATPILGPFPNAPALPKTKGVPLFGRITLM